MLSYCLKCIEKLQKVKIQKFQGQKTEQYCFHQNLQCVIVKKLKFLKQKEAEGLLSNLTGVKIPFFK